MPDGPNAIFQALGRAAGATGRNQTAQGTPGPAGDIAAGLGAAAGQASANENEAIPLSMTPQELAAFAGTPPRLVRALNTTPVVDAKTLPLYAEFKQLKGDVDLDFAAPGALEVRYLIRHIYDRLATPFVDYHGRAFSGSPWLGPDGGATLGDVSHDEHWARRAAEALSLLPYSTPSTVYGGYLKPKLRDEYMLLKLQGEGPESDHAYPLVLECQQSVTFAVLSRGYDIAVESDDADESEKKKAVDNIPRLRLKTLFGAGPSGSAVAVLSPASEATWVTREQGTTTLTKIGPGFGAGSAFAFNNSVLLPPGSEYKQTDKENPHTAFMIRGRRDDKGRLIVAQFFDVGGMNVRETPDPAIGHGIAPKPIHSYEYPWTRTINANGAYAGHTELHPSEETAWRGLQRLHDARPLGLARLVLVRRHNAVKGRAVDLQNDPPAEWLIYASPQMLMYEDGAGPYGQTPNYAPTRYAWSLRDMPGAEHIQAIWQITAPRSTFADAMAFARGTVGQRVPTTRATTLAEMLADVAARKPSWNIKLDGSKALTSQQEVIGVIDLTVKTDGQVQVHDAVRTDYKTGATTFVARDTTNGNLAGAYALGHFPWGRPTAGEGIDLATLTDLPPSFAAVTPPPPPPDPDDPYGD